MKMPLKRIENQKVIYSGWGQLLEELRTPEELYKHLDQITEEVAHYQQAYAKLARLSPRLAQERIPTKFLLEVERDKLKILEECLSSYQKYLETKSEISLPHPALIGHYLLWSCIGLLLFKNPFAALVYGGVGIPLGLATSDFKWTYRLKIPVIQKKLKASQSLSLKPKE